MNRRQFVKTISVAAAGLASDRVFAENNGMPYAVLGRTGRSVSRLGVGCGIFITRDFSAMEIASVVETACENGVNYIDTAPNYPGVQEKLGPIIEGIREKLFLVSKIEETTYDGAWRQLEKSMKHMKTDHLDLVHFHSFGDANRWPDIKQITGKNGALSALLKAGEEGVIGAIGASGHNNPSRYHSILDTGAIDVLMNVANFAMQHTYAFERKVWQRARDEKIGLVAMKVLGGVHPVTQKEFRFHIDDYENAVRYALSVPGVATAVIGMRDVFEVQEAVGTVRKFKPLSKSESAALSKKGQNIVKARPALWRKAWGAED